MSSVDQCPSTKGKQDIPAEPAELARLQGQAVWRSMEEFSGDPGFREFVEREFPKGASELAETSRRDFVKLMGASVALAGAATMPGCRRPDHKILAYSKEVPEEVIPGKALYYATSMALPGGGAEGLLVETHSGRPTKIEGNPQHPVNRGKGSIWSQASILGLYDPDRLKTPIYDNPARGKLNATWDDFSAWGDEHFKAHESDGGARLAFVVEKKTSPSRDAMRDAVLERFPNATWVAWNALQSDAPIEGSRLAFGRPMRVLHSFEKAEVILSLDSDFTAEGPNSITNARGFASTRRVMKAGDSMSRLYVAESMPSGVGGLADHRFAMKPSEISAMAVAVAKKIFQHRPAPGSQPLIDSMAGIDTAGVNATIVEEVAKDLMNSPAKSVVVAGDSQPAEVHALVHAINAALGNIGQTVTLLDMSEEEAASSIGQMRGLVEKMNAGSIDTLVCVGTNPAFDVPGELGFVEAHGKVGSTITWNVGPTETGAVSTWELNGTHDLESWGDAEAADGTISPIQPMIAPLFAPSMSELELLGMIAGRTGAATGYEIVREVWANRSRLSVDSGAFGTVWRRSLHNGVLAGSSKTPQRRAVAFVQVADAMAKLLAVMLAMPNDGLEVVYKPGRVWDGRYANNGWLQELPQIGTSVVWDNPALVSPSTAQKLRVLPEGVAEDNDVNRAYTAQQIPRARMATVNINGKTMEIPVWAMPGVPDDTIVMTPGYGRERVGLVGNGVGVNTYPVMPAGSMLAFGASMERASGWYEIASTQNHWSLEDRHALVRAMDMKWFDKYAKKDNKNKADKIYGTERGDGGLNLAEQLGELAHTPENVSIYENPLNGGPMDPMPGSAYSKGPQWGMSIDMNTCTGCNLCTVACQSENNIPIVGKTEVAKGREMQWIRVDRYFVGDDLNAPTEMYHQPIACVHCENAPCETVCPVNATVHGPEGTNNMAYNRCIGTRYCANNCPYKVRRFNFFDYAVAKFNGGLDPKYVSEGIAKNSAEDITFNENLIPPRLRAKLDEISHMKHNPDVTVRSRGVMEKCTYCIQRINEARMEVKIKDIWTEEAPIPDGYFQVACQQACPTGAIDFGDILDESSAIHEVKQSPRSYLLLGYLNTRPRTTHMMRVRNPNEKLLAAIDPDSYEHRIKHDPLDHGGGGSEHKDDAHGGEGHGDEHVFLDRVRRAEDDGYALSLKVLGHATGVNA